MDYICSEQKRNECMEYIKERIDIEKVKGFLLGVGVTVAVYIATAAYSVITLIR